ncbi:MAG: hypothetical protein HY680_10835 [Chloroflexi bacterium]|nr:hypothetical protein [Chloroflexota bacterium]
MKLKRFHIALLVALVALAAVPLAVSASHSWNGYHWARTSNPFTLKLGDNVSSTWDAHLAAASDDWSLSTVLDTTVVPGQAKGSCSKVTKGRVEVCNKAYGLNGWLGVAGVWVSGSHITQAYVKLNDTYFNTSTYNTPAWRQFVTCQEIGHTLGLDHQDEDFSNPNLGTCMDYTSDPSTNQHPDQHDYDELEAIYSHLDTTTTIKASTGSQAAAGPANGQDGEDWGVAVRSDARGRPNLFVKDEGGAKKFTWVYWAD